MSKSSKDNSILQLRISLVGIEPMVWRTVQVPRDITLGDLHCVIQVLFGWENAHLHEFVKGDRFKGVRYGEPSYEEEEGEVTDEDSVQLFTLFPRKGSKLEYWYDFGDDWQHRIVLEERLSEDPSKSYPLCVDGQRACPPEDSGGPCGYLEKVEAKRAARSGDADEHQAELAEWMGDFDPEAFDVKDVDFAALLGRGRRRGQFPALRPGQEPDRVALLGRGRSAWAPS